MHWKRRYLEKYQCDTMKGPWVKFCMGEWLQERNLTSYNPQIDTYFCLLCFRFTVLYVWVFCLQICTCISSVSGARMQRLEVDLPSCGSGLELWLWATIGCWKFLGALRKQALPLDPKPSRQLLIDIFRWLNKQWLQMAERLIYHCTEQ